jgi:hypothetical protein
MLVIPATGEAEIGSIHVQVQLRPKVHKIPSQLIKIGQRGMHLSYQLHRKSVVQASPPEKTQGLIVK